MDCTEEPQPIFKHYCRICKKGFMCGRALGGHMRAHGIGDENANLDDDDGASDWEDHRTSSSTTRRMYQLRTNPNRLKSCRVCENCGKEFLSWKSFLEHGKCSSEDAESLVSSPGSDGDYEEGERKGGCQQWSKRKRSLRTKVGSYCSSANPNGYYANNNNNSSCYDDQDEDDLLLAKCLVELANTNVEAEPDQESCASASRDEAAAARIPVNAYFNQYPSFSNRYTSYNTKPTTTNTSNQKGGMFECKACKKVFNSHQALGGHRASHKKVKGCYAAKQDQIDEIMTPPAEEDVISHDEFFPNSSKSLSFQYDHQSGSSRRKSKVHECTICHRVFSTGQALGGHKRCHWITSNSQDPNINSPVVKLHFPDQMDRDQANAHKSRRVLDLNIPANHGDHSSVLKRSEPQNLLSLEVSTDIHLHPWANIDHEKVNTKVDQHAPTNVNSNGGLKIENADNDEADSNKVKRLGKLSDLKDINLSTGNSSQWLQVGIGTTSTTADQQVTSHI